MNFERGQSAYDALKIGRRYKEVKKGDQFLVDFNLRKSCPEYYPLQRQKVVIAEALTDIEDPYYGVYLSIKCKIEGIRGEFNADFWESKQIWVIE